MRYSWYCSDAVPPLPFKTVTIDTVVNQSIPTTLQMSTSSYKIHLNMLRSIYTWCVVIFFSASLLLFNLASPGQGLLNIYFDIELCYNHDHRHTNNNSPFRHLFNLWLNTGIKCLNLLCHHCLWVTTVGQERYSRCSHGHEKYFSPKKIHFTFT